MEINQFSFHTKIKGISFRNPRVIKELKKDEQLTILRERDNEYDSNAIKIYDSKGNELGYISREIAYHMGPAMDQGIQYRVTVSEITGLYRDDGNIGCNILVERVGESR